MTQPDLQPTPDQWRTFFRACAARPISAGARMRGEKEAAWRLRGERCELCGVVLTRGELVVAPLIPATLGGRAVFGNGMNCCPACADGCRHIDALPLIDSAPAEFRERLMERREAALAGSFNEPTPGGLNRAGREALLAARWAYPRTVCHIDVAAGLLGFQRAFTPDPLLGALVMVVRATGAVIGDTQERRWAGLHVAPDTVAFTLGALTRLNVLKRRQEPTRKELCNHQR